MALDQATQQFVQQLAAQQMAIPFSQLQPEQVRKGNDSRAAHFMTGPDIHDVKDFTLPVSHNGTMRMRILTPLPHPTAIVLYYHGGGWMAGSLESYDAMARNLAADANATVVLAEYRKAPEHQFPIPVEDSWTAYQWVTENRTALAAPKSPLFVAGDSAGGNLATIIARKARDAAAVQPDGQILIYPVTDHVFTRGSYLEAENQTLLTAEAMQYFWDHYLPDEAQRKHPDASPLYTQDLSGLAPALVITAEHDVLRDEGEDYAAQLSQAGVPVTQHRWPGQMHGFIQMAGLLPASQEATRYIATYIKNIAESKVSSKMRLPKEVDALIVGAGFSGLYMLYRLRKLGLNTVAVEQGDGVGGTWYWNRYPGARCDVESPFYSYSFDEDLQQEWQWTERYATQPELLAYINHVADRFDLRKNVYLETKVVSAIFDETDERWTVTSTGPDGGSVIRAKYCIMATGCLSSARMPDIPGLDSFQGRLLHTGEWPHEEVDFSGQTVGVIGTGSSGVQAIPLIAEQAEELKVFQRTPNFSVPAHNGPIDQEWFDKIKANYPELRERSRHTTMGIPHDRRQQAAIDVSPEERRRVFEDHWPKGGFRVSSCFNDLMRNKESNDALSDFVRDKISEIVDDPETAAKLKPYGYPNTGKRICVDTNYYATFNRDNVELVDVKSDPIQEITPTGVRTGNRHVELDALVVATGFDAMTGSMLRMDIHGRDGISLRDHWDAGARTYLGLAISGFPNLFTIAGPGSPSVLSNMLTSIEQHVDWVTDHLSYMQDNGLEVSEAKESSEDHWVEHVRELADKTLFPTANSWYLGANVPGKPRVFMPYVGGVGNYRAHCEEVAAQDYAGFALK